MRMLKHTGINTYLSIAKTILFLTIFLFVTNYLYAQNHDKSTDTHKHKNYIVLFDKKHNHPVSYVFAFNQNKTITKISDINGKLSIADFRKSDTLFLQHPSYEIKSIAVNQINDTLVYMTSVSVELAEIHINTSGKESKNEVPNQIVHISRKEIEKYNAQTSADLLSATGEVYVQKSQLGGGSPMLRGFAANSVLLVFDGVRMNNAIYRSGNLQNIINIDANAILHSEVIFGPGSVLYGSDALGGVMLFSSLQPGNNKKAGAMLRYSTANKEKTANASYKFSKGKWQLAGSVSYSQFEDLRVGTNINDEYENIAQRKHYVMRIGTKDSVFENTNPYIQRFTGFRQWSMLQKIRYKTTPYKSFQFTVYYNFTDTVPRYDRLTQYVDDTPKYASWNYGPQNWLFTNLQFTDSAANRLYDNFDISLSYQFYNESRFDRKLNNDWQRELYEKLHILALNTNFEYNFNNHWMLNYGAELNSNIVFSDGLQRNIVSNYTKDEASRYPPTSYYNSAAAYTFLKFSTNDKLMLKTGLRYSYINLHSEFGNKSFFDFPYEKLDLKTAALNGSFGLTWFISQQTTLYSTLSSGFRAPNLDDIAKIYDSQPGVVVVPNKQLKPEYLYNVDMKLHYRNNWFEGGFSAFYSYLTNAMVRRDFTFNGNEYIIYAGELSRVQAVVNAANARIYGLSGFSKIRFGNIFSNHNTISITKGYDNENIPLRHIPPLYGKISFVAQKNELYVEVYSVFNAKKPATEFSPSEAAKTHIYATDSYGNAFMPSWFTLNLRTSYTVESFTISAGLENITDIYYRTYSSGVGAPGRNFYVALRYRL